MPCTPTASDPPIHSSPKRVGLEPPLRRKQSRARVARSACPRAQPDPVDDDVVLRSGFARNGDDRRIQEDRIGPHRAVLKLVCTGQGCPSNSKSAAVVKPAKCKGQNAAPRSSNVDLTRLFRGHRLSAGSRITVTQRNTNGEAFAFAIPRLSCRSSRSAVWRRGQAAQPPLTRGRSIRTSLLRGLAAVLSRRRGEIAGRRADPGGRLAAQGHVARLSAPSQYVRNRPPRSSTVMIASCPSWAAVSTMS